MQQILHHAPLLLGCLLCATVVMQITYWTAGTLVKRQITTRRVRHQLRDFEQRLAARTGSVSSTTQQNSWQGFRIFRVDRIESETTDTKSIYLIPEDNKPLPHFLPGQYLTFKINLPEQTQPVIRCYSISNEPHAEFYRCTIKQAAPPAGFPDAPPGKSSTYLNQRLAVGDTLELKSPRGKFHLQMNVRKPVVLLAGGIGVTPLLSMIKFIGSRQPDRKTVLFYGVNNGPAHAFKEELKQLVSHHANLHVITCYANPLSGDTLGQDYQVQGFVTPELLTKVLPAAEFEFYMCGPPAFMESLHTGLIDRGAKTDQIHYESFGPASVKTAQQLTSPDEFAQGAKLENRNIFFAQTNRTVTWDGQHGTLLELAEAVGIELPSGCRSGSCGTCALKIREGRTSHIKEIAIELNEGDCLACIAQPVSDLVIDA